MSYARLTKGLNSQGPVSWEMGTCSSASLPIIGGGETLRGKVGVVAWQRKGENIKSCDLQLSKRVKKKKKSGCSLRPERRHQQLKISF